MKEYKIIHIRKTSQETEDMLNSLAQEGWKVVCSYSQNNCHLILTREKKRKKGGKRK